MSYRSMLVGAVALVFLLIGGTARAAEGNDADAAKLRAAEAQISVLKEQVTQLQDMFNRVKAVLGETEARILKLTADLDMERAVSAKFDAQLQAAQRATAMAAEQLNVAKDENAKLRARVQSLEKELAELRAAGRDGAGGDAKPK